MTSVRVLVVLALALSAIVCGASKASSDIKRTAKPTSEPKKIEDRTTKEKRDSSEITTLYAVKQKDEPFRPIYQYQYQGAPLRPTHYVAAASSPQITYNKPESVIGIAAESSQASNEVDSASVGNTAGIQYATVTAYKPQASGGIQYAPAAFKAPVNAASGRIQYASSAYRGPFVTTYQPASAGEVKVHPIYASPQPSNHPPQAVSLPLHYGSYEQQLPPPQHHHQHPSVYAIAFPADYMRHYQQNLAAPFQVHGAHFVPMVYTAGPVQQPALKEQPLKPAPVHFISLAPHSPAAAASSPVPATLPASGPTLITHIIPLYGHGPHHHQHLLQQAPPVPYFFGSHHQQGPPAIAYTAPPQQQTIQITPKHQIFGPIQMATVATAAGAATTIPIIPFKPIVVAPQHQHQHPHQQHQQQQQQQQLQQSHHSSGTTYHRYAPSPSVSSSSGNSGGSGNSIEIPSSEAGHPTAVLKLTQLHSSPASTSNIYSSAIENSIGGVGGGGGGGKLSYTYASNGNSIGAMYTHPGAVQYGTHLYHPSAKVIEIGGNRVTAGSAAIAGVAPPAYHSQQSANSNGAGSSAGAGSGGNGGSSSVIKFS